MSYSRVSKLNRLKTPPRIFPRLFIHVVKEGNQKTLFADRLSRVNGFEDVKLQLYRISCELANVGSLNVLITYGVGLRQIQN